MQGNWKGVNLGRYWPFWRLHFGGHLIIGLLAIMAGITVIFVQGEILNGLALVGAGSFAMINGWQGFMELKNNKTHEHDIKTRESSQ